MTPSPRETPPPAVASRSSLSDRTQYSLPNEISVFSAGVSTLHWDVPTNLTGIVSRVVDVAGRDSSGKSRFTDQISIVVLARTVPRDFVDEVLTETGTREKRARLLPAHVVIYFVMAMAIFKAA